MNLTTPADSGGALHPRVAVVVAHPDDETLWCGGYILAHPEFHWRIVTLCRASDPDRAPKFERVLRALSAEGTMGDLDDGPDQTPLNPALVLGTIARLLPGPSFDLLLTHSPQGEYSSHRRHAECSTAVVGAWRTGLLPSARLWLFAYDDGDRTYLPRVRPDADRRDMLTESAWLEKRRLITDLYGFAPDSWEARTTPREEGFWCLDSARDDLARIASTAYPS